MDIIINGEITDKTVGSFANLDGDVSVRINSVGGDITSALTIYNRLKAHSNVSIVIEGLCASAATVIACAGYVKAYENALLMIHSPLASLNDGLYQADDLSKTIDALAAFEGSILDIYHAKTGQPLEKLKAMVDEETWLTAEDAKALGFVDEIIGERATVEDRGGVTYINQVATSEAHFKKKGELRRMEDMSNKTLLDELKAFFKGTDTVKLKAELESARAESKALNQMVLEREAELARSRDKVNQLEAELETTRAQLKTNREIYALIEDNIKSGASKVRASTAEADDVRARNINRVVAYANGKGV